MRFLKSVASDGGDKFMYDTLQGLFKIPQCTPSTIIKNEK
jgi:hypothetical protein